MQQFTIKLALMGLMLFNSVNANQASENLANQFKAVSTIQGDFTQVVYSQNKQVLASSKGNFKIKRPNQFRWNAITPLQQLTIADGKTIWLYQPDLEQVTESVMTSRIGHTPLAILSGSSSALSQSYTITQSATDSYQLIAKSATDAFHKILITIKDKKISEMDLYDTLGQKTKVMFSKVQLNSPINKNAFQFVAPKGVDVIKS